MGFGQSTIHKNHTFIHFFLISGHSYSLSDVCYRIVIFFTCSSLCFHCCHPPDWRLWSSTEGLRSSLAIPDSVILGGGAQDFWGIFLKAKLRNCRKEIKPHLNVCPSEHQLSWIGAIFNLIYINLVYFYTYIVYIYVYSVGKAFFKT